MAITRFFTLLLLAGLSTHCSSDGEPDVAPEPTISFDDASRAVLRDVTPLLAGKWTMEQVQIRRIPYHMYPQSFPKDTILQQFATLTLELQPPTKHSNNGLYPEFKGTMTYRNVTYPIGFRLQASPNRYMEKVEVGPHALLLFDYGPMPLHNTTADEWFFQEIGLMGENFSLEVVKGEPTMLWRGLSRHVEQIVLRKQ